jgi:predicted acylesterase/phospholipase RssA
VSRSSRIRIRSLLLLLTLAAGLNRAAEGSPHPVGGGGTALRHADNRPRVGLVLSGGGGRGLSQIGVLKSLEKHGIAVDLIVGTSFGSVVGGLLASGYSPAEIEGIAKEADWTELLSFSEDTKRTDLFVGQREAYPVGELVIRFDGLEPILPSSISGGQRLSDFFSRLALQAPYHPDPTFDGLRIPFRAVSTDLVSGRRVVIDRGSLAEAMRASVTVPLLYAPLERDSLYLVDGGLLANIPVDVARDLGCGVVIAVNTTSSLRTREELGAPWEVADQIMGIMMQQQNARQLAMADVVITPETGNRIVSDFSGVDDLIAQGERAGDAAIEEILMKLGNLPETGPAEPDTGERTPGQLPPWSGLAGLRPGRFTYSGNNHIPDSLITEALASAGGEAEVPDLVESVLSLYRTQGYSLARIDSAGYDPSGDLFSFHVDEGVIAKIMYVGNERTKDYIIRREFPMDVGDVFTIGEAEQGLTNIKSTGLFEYVLLDVRAGEGGPVVILRVKENSAEIAQIGFRADEAYGFIAGVTLRDANFRGAWEDATITGRAGERFRLLMGKYVVNRIFNSYLTLDARAYLRSRDINVYADDTSAPAGKFDRVETGRYRNTINGASLSFGSHFERFGDVSALLRAERQRISALSGTGYSPEAYNFVSLSLRSVVDTKNKFLFPTDGIYLSLSYETASRRLGSEVSFVKIGVTYESYITFFSSHTIRPRVVFGFADQTLPVTEQFYLGGLHSFYGIREDDARGRQILATGLEYRYRLPFRLLFDSYLRARYDLGMISAVPEDIKFSRFRHGIGAELSLDTPVGEVSAGFGKSFYFRHELPNSPVTTGPLLFYFTIGPNF